jgi:hypothetical protein
MTEEIERQKRGEGFRTLGVIIPSLPSLIFRFGGVLLKFKREAKKGGKIFQKELISQGLDATTAAAFTDMYLESSSLTHYVDFLR